MPVYMYALRIYIETHLTLKWTKKKPWLEEAILRVAHIHSAAIHYIFIIQLEVLMT